MKDLYRRNNLQPLETDSAKIKNAKSWQSDDREAAFSILLKPERKKRYDQTYSTLQNIALLRRRFGLLNKNNWDLRYSDFANASTLTEKLKGDSKQAKNNGVPKKTALKHANKIFTVGIILFAAILVWFLNHEISLDTMTEDERQAVVVSKYAIADGVQIHSEASDESPVLGEMNQFTNARVFVNQGNRKWDYVQVGTLKGFVSKAFLQDGEGDLAYINYCRGFGETRPDHGTSLLYRQSGPHTLIVVNPPGKDAIVKLKDSDERDVIAYYVHGGKTLIVNDVPEGEFEFYYATGSSYSIPCGRFLDGMQAWKNDAPTWFTMEQEGQLQFPTKISFSLKNQFAINVPVDLEMF